MSNTDPNTVLRMPKTSAKSGLSKPSIYRKVADGTFPKPIKLGKRAIGWLEKDIEDWISNQIEATKKANNI